MTVTNQTSEASFIGNGAATEFTFQFFIPTDGLQVLLAEANVETLLDPSTYSVTGLDNPAGGVVTYNPPTGPITAQQRLIVRRSLPYTQPLNLEDQQTYYPSVIMQGLNRLTYLTQQLFAFTQRALLAPVDTNPDTVLATILAAEGRVVDGNWKFVERVTPTGRVLIFPALPTSVSEFELRFHSVSLPGLAGFTSPISLELSMPAVIPGGYQGVSVAMNPTSTASALGNEWIVIPQSASAVVSGFINIKTVVSGPGHGWVQTHSFMRNSGGNFAQISGTGIREAHAAESLIPIIRLPVNHAFGAGGSISLWYR